MLSQDVHISIKELAKLVPTPIIPIAVPKALALGIIILAPIGAETECAGRPEKHVAHVEGLHSVVVVALRAAYLRVR